MAIIYASTKGLIDRVPVEKVKEFEKEYLTVLRTSHKDALDLLKAGKLEDSVIKTMEEVAKDLSSRY